MPAWESAEHLADHYGQHRREFPGFTIDQDDASAQETIAFGTRFTFIDRGTRERRTGYFHRDSSRFVVVDDEGYIHSHFRIDEAHVADLIASTYRD